jgi:hypothetical protein
MSIYSIKNRERPPPASAPPAFAHHLAARQIQRDWLGACCYAPVLLETFVVQAFHSGARYRAANWECLWANDIGADILRPKAATRNVVFCAEEWVEEHPVKKHFFLSVDNSASFRNRRVGL